jgi:hypothetical protein
MKRTNPTNGKNKRHTKDKDMKSPKYLRLWDMAKGKFRWEREDFGGRILGFTEKYVVRGEGYLHLHERKNGNVHGKFQLPSYHAYILQTVKSLKIL